MVTVQNKQSRRNHDGTAGGIIQMNGERLNDARYVRIELAMRMQLSRQWRTVGIGATRFQRKQSKWSSAKPNEARHAPTLAVNYHGRGPQG